MKHEATDDEKKLVDEISNHIREEFCLIRITSTMLEKSTIDANRFVQKMFKEQAFFDYSKAVDGRLWWLSTVN